MPLLNQAEYGRHRGVSKVAVFKAIKSGRIAAAFRDGKLDSDLADKLWTANTDESKPKGKAPAGHAAPSKPAKAGKQAPEAGTRGGQQAAGTGTGYTAARTVRESYLARLAKLDFEERAAKLVDAEVVRRMAYTAGRAARDAVIGLADRIAPLVAGETEAFRCHEIIRRECEKICEDIAKYESGPIASE